MSKKLIRIFAVLAILVSIVANTGVVRADPAGEKTAAEASASPGTSPWFVGWADKTTSANIGSYPSIAYSPVDGLPYVSYYDATNGNLMLASPVTSGGNCGDNNLWWCRVVDAGGHSNFNVGQFSSIAFWSGTIGILQAWKLGISYHDASNRALKVAVWTQTALDASWKVSTISSTDSTHAGNDVGTYTSIKFSSGGTPYIAYYSHVYSTFQSDYIGSLYLAMQVANGGNCGVGAADAGKWQCDTIEFSPGTGMGQYASLGLGYNNVPYMSYYDAFNANLKYAHYDGPGTGNCYLGSNYSCMTIDSAGNVGLFTSLTAPRSSTDKPRIAYYHKTNGKLKYATPSSGGNCGGGAWQCLNIDSMGANLSQAGISMALDKDGRPIIAYENASQDQAPSTLKIARPIEAVGELIGNCGDIPTGYLFFIWQCDTIDNAAYGSGWVNVADYTSVAINPTSGLGTIAYFETDDYDLRSNLKVAYQRFQVFLPLIKR